MQVKFIYIYTQYTDFFLRKCHGNMWGMLLAYYKIKQQVLYKPNLLKSPTGFLITCTIDIYTSAKLQRDHTNPTQHFVCLSFRSALLFGHLIQFKTKYM